MKKTLASVALVVLLGSVGFFAFKASGLNFSGQQTLNGLAGQSTVSAGLIGSSVFAAPVSGVYFVNGQLTLPMQTGSGQSQVVATVTVGNSTWGGSTVIYTGLPGATGFQINQISLAGGSTVSVWLTSSAPADQPLNAVRGVVSFGNTF